MKLYSVKHFGVGYWILSEILSILEGGNKKSVKYFMEKSGARFAGVRTPLTFTIFVLEGRGVSSDLCWGRDIDFFSNFGWVLPGRGVDLCLFDDFLSIFLVSSGRGLFYDIFLNDYPTWVEIHYFTPHESILYPVWVPKILAHNVDATKHRPNLS